MGAAACGLAACAQTPTPTPTSTVAPPTATVIAVERADAAVLPTPPSDPPRDVDAAADGGPSPVERAVVAKLKTVHPTLLACHRLAKNFGGDFTLVMMIGAGGKLTNVAVTKRSGTPAAVASCVLDRVRALRFDVESTAIELPFHFVDSAYDGPVLHYGSGPYDPGY